MNNENNQVNVRIFYLVIDRNMVKLYKNSY